MSRAARAIRSTLLNGLAAGVSALSTLATSVLVARSLGPELMGSYSYGLWWAGVFGLVAHFGLGPLLTKYVAELEGQQDRALAAHVVWRSLLVSGGLAVACGALAVAVARGAGTIPDPGLALLSGLLVIPAALQQTAAGALTGLQRFARMAQITIFSSLVKLACVGVAAWERAGAAGMLAAAVVGAFLEVLLWLWPVHRDLLSFRPATAPPAAPGLFRRLRRLALIEGFGSFTDMVVWQRSETFFLKRYVSMASIAEYGIAFDLVTRANALAYLLSGVLLPMGAEAHGRGESESFVRMYDQGMRYMAMMSLPAAFAGVVIARPLVQALYGEPFLPLVPAIQIMLLSVPVLAVSSVGHMVVYAYEKQAVFVRISVVIMAANLLLAWWLIPALQLVGAAVANTLSQTGAVLWGGIYIQKKIIREPFRWRPFLRIGVAALLAYAPAYLLSTRALPAYWVWASAALATAVYAALLCGLGEFGRSELAALKHAFAWQQGSMARNAGT